MVVRISDKTQNYSKVTKLLVKPSKNIAIILYLALDTIATCFGLLIVDYCMSTIAASDLSKLVISFILALPGIDDFKNM